MKNVSSKFTKYAEDVVNGNIVAGELVKLACKRYLSWFDRDDIYFDEARAEKPVKFIAKLKHRTGKFNNQPFILQDWQEFLVYAIFGWIRKDNNTRLIRSAYIQISRKCGKTSLASALGLYGMIADEESGAEITCVAPSAEQSRIAFKNASSFLESINKFSLFRALRGEIRFDKTKSRFRIMSSDANFGDGFNPSLAIIDEYHAMKNNDIPNVLISGMGMRTQPLMLYITTAGFDLFSPCKIYRDMCEDILRGVKEDDTIFSLIYEMDENDDFNDSKNWKKCCPSLGITVTDDYMKQQLKMMINNPSDEVPILTKTFNKWCSSSDSWLPNSLLVKSTQKVNLEDFKDKKIIGIMGVDLAAVSDLTCISLIFNYLDKFYFKTWIFLPESALEESPNKDMYKRWKREKLINITPGNATDYDYVLNKIMEINKYITIWKIEYDTWNATQFTENAIQNRLKMEPFSQTLGNFNRPTKEFERLVRLGKVVIDDNEAVRWCFSNTTIKTDWNDNAKPVKGGTKYGKIDAVISMLQALGGMLYTKSFNHFFAAI
jgi:phage terminase large subunit-like protein